jgi:hypothetical protein
MLLLLLLPMNDDDEDDPAQASRWFDASHNPVSQHQQQAPALATSSTRHQSFLASAPLLSTAPFFSVLPLGPSFNVSDLMHRPASRDVYGMCGVGLTNSTD